MSKLSSLLVGGNAGESPRLFWRKTAWDSTCVMIKDCKSSCRRALCPAGSEGDGYSGLTIQAPLERPGSWKTPVCWDRCPRKLYAENPRSKKGISALQLLQTLSKGQTLLDTCIDREAFLQWTLILTRLYTLIFYMKGHDPCMAIIM